MAGKTKTRAPYRMVSPPTWELARADYLGGMTAQAVADKYAIGLHNLRQTIARKGWSKRALADARAGAGPGGPATTATPGSAPEPAASDPPAQGDLLQAVLARVRAALTAGRGAEASALLKAVRDYVIVRQDIADARAANAGTVAIWDEAQPARAGEVAEVLTIQTLHARWTRLTPEEQADRIDPTGEMGMQDLMAAAGPDRPRGRPR